MKADKTEQLNAIRCKDNRSTLTVVTHIPGVIFWRSRHSRSVNYKKLAFPAAHTHIPPAVTTMQHNKYCCYRHITTSSRQGLRSTIMLIGFNKSNQTTNTHKKYKKSEDSNRGSHKCWSTPQTPGAPQQPQKKHHENQQPKTHLNTPPAWTVVLLNSGHRSMNELNNQ